MLLRDQEPSGLIYLAEFKAKLGDLVFELRLAIRIRVFRCCGCAIRMRQLTAI